jgi:hypothetical protein
LSDQAEQRKNPDAVALGRMGGLASPGGRREGAGRKPSCVCGSCVKCVRRRKRQSKEAGAA